MRVIVIAKIENHKEDAMILRNIAQLNSRELVLALLNEGEQNALSMCNLSGKRNQQELVSEGRPG